MTITSRDEEFSAFVRARRSDLLRSAYLLTAGDRHLAEDLVQTALAKLYVAWPRARRDGQVRYAWRILVNAHIDEVRQPDGRGNARSLRRRTCLTLLPHLTRRP